MVCGRAYLASLGAANAAGGHILTERMLAMFKSEKEGATK